MTLSLRIRARHLAALAFRLGLLALPAIEASQTSARFVKVAMNEDGMTGDFTDICSSQLLAPEEIVVKPGVS